MPILIMARTIFIRRRCFRPNQGRRFQRRFRSSEPNPSVDESGSRVFQTIGAGEVGEDLRDSRGNVLWGLGIKRFEKKNRSDTPRSAYARRRGVSRFSAFFTSVAIFRTSPSPSLDSERSRRDRARDRRQSCTFCNFITRFSYFFTNVYCT